MKQLLLLALVCLGLYAEPPAVGDKAQDFELKSLDGKPVRLSKMTAKGPVVLVVLRGFPGYQCPMCNRQVKDLTSHASEFAGAKVLMVYPGPAEGLGAKAKEFAADKDLPRDFTMVLDPDYKFTQMYDLRWAAPNETAYPSTFILDKDRKISFAKISKTHGGRTTATEIGEALKASARQ